MRSKTPICQETPKPPTSLSLQKSFFCTHTFPANQKIPRSHTYQTSHLQEKRNPKRQKSTHRSMFKLPLPTNSKSRKNKTIAILIIIATHKNISPSHLQTLLHACLSL
jgi:hypothetical protein